MYLTKLSLQSVTNFDISCVKHSLHFHTGNNSAFGNIFLRGTALDVNGSELGLQ